jgi:hypothetical protein
MKTGPVMAAALALAGASCVSRQPPHPDWPRAGSLKSLSQLDGVYRNDSDDHQTGTCGGSTRSLYDFLKGELGTTSKEGREVELRASPDGKELRLQLRGARGRVLAAETLRTSDGDFILESNSLAVRTHESGRLRRGCFGDGETLGSRKSVRLPVGDRCRTSGFHDPHRRFEQRALPLAGDRKIAQKKPRKVGTFRGGLDESARCRDQASARSLFRLRCCG